MCVSMATNFTVKMGDIGRLTSIRRLGIPKRSGISQFRFQNIHWRLSGYITKNLVNFGPVTPEFKKLKAYNARRSAVYLRSLGSATAAHWGIITEFCGAISTQFLSLLFARGDTAIPRGQHARLCQAFLSFCALRSYIAINRLVQAQTCLKYPLD